MALTPGFGILRHGQFTADMDPFCPTLLGMFPVISSVFLRSIFWPLHSGSGFEEQFFHFVFGALECFWSFAARQNLTRAT